MNHQNGNVRGGGEHRTFVVMEIDVEVCLAGGIAEVDGTPVVPADAEQALIIGHDPGPYRRRETMGRTGRCLPTPLEHSPLQVNALLSAPAAPFGVSHRASWSGSSATDQCRPVVHDTVPGRQKRHRAHRGLPEVCLLFEHVARLAWIIPVNCQAS